MHKNGDGGDSVELLKLSFDWCKHIATLSTGSILLIVTFLEKLSKHPEWKILLPIALIGFVVAILGGLGIQFEHLRKGKFETPSSLGTIALLLLLGGFLVGIVALTVFGSVNLL